MPRKALVAFGVVLAVFLPVLSAPGHCANADATAGGFGRPVDTAPKSTEEQSVKPAATLPALTLDEALERALRHSPKLAVFSREVEAREFEARQAGLRPNPELSVEVENLAGSGDYSGADRAETTVRISQLVELGGKRARRLEVGRLEREVAEREYDIARSEVLAETRDRFLAALAAREKLSLAEEQVGLAQRVLKAVEERIVAGKTAAIEGERFRTLAAETRLRRDKARRELTAARLTLAAAWGAEEADFETVEGTFEQLYSVPTWSELMSGLDRSPELALKRSDSKRIDGILALERANRIPDVTASLGARNYQESGDNAIVAELSISLPIFDRNQGAVGAARARLARAGEAERDARLRLRAGLAEAWLKLYTARDEVTVLRDEVVPASRKTFDALAYGYQAGKFGFLEVLDAERTLFEARSRYVDALTAYHRAVADLERLLGRKLSSERISPSCDEIERGQS